MGNSIINKCAEILNNAENVMVLTGAGMSTESGIPDFRSKTGYFSKKFKGFELVRVVSLQFFLERPDVFYDFFKEQVASFNVQPNRGHKILAQWESKGLVRHIVTQNIDGLHQKAGSKDVLEVHGDTATATCGNPKCRAVYNLRELLKMDGEFWKCDCGNGLIKPNVVLYDEPVTKIQEALRYAEEADALLILGTSLQVNPIANIPMLNKEKPIIIINYDTTPFDHLPNNIAIHAGIGETLEKINELL